MTQPNREHLDNVLLEILRGLIALSSETQGSEVVEAQKVEVKK